MYIVNIYIILVEVILLRWTKSAMLIGLGALGVLAYQRYGGAVKDKACEVVDNTMNKIGKKMA